VLTTHYLEEAEQLADRIGVIHQGRLLLVEECASLMNRHRNASVTLVLEHPVDSLPSGLPQGARLRDSRRIEVPWRGPDELEAALSRVKAQVPIYDLSVQQTTLEDIFVDLIHSADAERAR
jgi:ABC-2 type transport system ATP-binding protein